MPAAVTWTNRFTNCPLVATPSNGGGYTSAAFDAAYPAINIINPDPSKVARMNFVRSGSSTYVLPYFQFHASVQQTATAIAMLNVRLPASVTQVDLALHNAAGASVFYVSYTAANLVPIPGTTNRYNLFGVLTVDTSALAVGLLVYCPINTADYVEFGYVWAGRALLLPLGVDSNWSLGFVDPSDVERSRGGALVANQLPRRRRLRAPITTRDYNTAHGTPGTASVLSLRQMSLEAGLSAPVIVIPRSDTQHALQVASIYGALTDLRDISHQGGDYYGTEITVEEIR